MSERTIIVGLIVVVGFVSLLVAFWLLLFADHTWIHRYDLAKLKRQAEYDYERNQRLFYDLDRSVDRVRSLETKLSIANHRIRLANNRIEELKRGHNASKPVEPRLPFNSDYELLGCGKNVDRATLKKKYKTLASVYHADKGASNDKIMKALNNAYQRVLNTL